MELQTLKAQLVLVYPRGKDFVGLMSGRSKSQSVRGCDVLLSLAVRYE